MRYLLLGIFFISMASAAETPTPEEQARIDIENLPKAIALDKKFVEGSAAYLQETSQNLANLRARLAKLKKHETVMRADLEKMIALNEAAIQERQAQLSQAQTNLLFRQKQLVTANEVVRDYAVLDKRPELRKCNPSTPTLNLEENGGPFQGIPRDNQDGLGTCYANTAKNLLIGLSGGEMQASFLDLALKFKQSRNAIPNDGLEGGITCGALNSLKESGYCPQKFAPYESGEKNHLWEGLIGKKVDSSSWTQALTIKSLKEFLHEKQVLLNKNPYLDGDILKKAGWVVEQLKKNPRIKVPLPVARLDIPGHGRMLRLYEGNKDKFKVSEKEFFSEFNESYRKFYPKFLKGVVNGKSPAQLFEMFRNELGPFLRKYDVPKAEVDEWLRVFKIEASEDVKDKKYKQSLKDSLEFLKALTGKTGESDDAFIDYCTSDLTAEIDFLRKLQPLMNRLKGFEVDAGILVKDGEFKGAEELMQLAVAPACLHPENRKPITFDFTCDDGFWTVSKIKTSKRPLSEQLDMFRNRIALNLLEGRAVGNLHVNGSDGHINSIVGLRYNPELKGCEYLIRESQNGISSWQPETKIFEEIDGLTEVRKK